MKKVDEILQNVDAFQKFLIPNGVSRTEVMCQRCNKWFIARSDSPLYEPIPHECFIETSYDFDAEHDMHSYYETRCELCLIELEQAANEKEFKQVN